MTIVETSVESGLTRGAKESIAETKKSAGIISPVGFSRNQLRKLTRSVDARHIHQRDVDGKKLSYIEGWFALKQANEIFGYAGWDREMVHFERITERVKSDTVTVGYVARVRVRVRGGLTEIIREGTGYGCVINAHSPAAHERALKSAETDATKRALSTFGPSFGLSLYDKDHPGRCGLGLALFGPDGVALDRGLSPESFCTGLKQLIALCDSYSQLEYLQRYNVNSLSQLRDQAPGLCNAQGTHFADLLSRLIERRRQTMAAVGEARADPDGDRPSELRSSGEKRGGFGRAPGWYSAQSVHRRSQPAFRETSAHLTAVESDCTMRIQPNENPSSPRCNMGGPAKEEANHDVAIHPGASAAEKLVTASKSFSSEERDFGDGKGAMAAPSIAVSADVSNIQNEGLTAQMLAPSRIASGSRIDKSALHLPLERRLRDKQHLKKVGELPCLVCNRQPSHAHHLRFAQRRGMAQKVSDEFVVPLCALHHGDLHRSSSEQEWWARQNIDPVPISADLWRANHQ